MRRVTIDALEYVLDPEVTDGLTMAERLLLIALATNAEKAPADGPWRWAVPLTYEQLSDASGVSLRHTYQGMKQLLERGLTDRILAIEDRAGDVRGRWFVHLLGPKP